MDTRIIQKGPKHNGRETPFFNKHSITLTYNDYPFVHCYMCISVYVIWAKLTEPDLCNVLDDGLMIG